MLIEAPTVPVVDFDMSKMGSTLQETLEEMSLEGDYTHCTEDESDDSSQAGNHFVHLKKSEVSDMVESEQVEPREDESQLDEPEHEKQQQQEQPSEEKPQQEEVQLDEPEQDEEEEQGELQPEDSHPLDDVPAVSGQPQQVQELPERFSRRSSSILKHTSPSGEYIVSKRRSWKNLPPPDLLKIRANSERLLSESQSTQSTLLTRRATHVVFDEVTLRFYDQTLGDHPSTSYGPPISLDWKYEEAEPMKLDSYEEHRGKRRDMKQMMMNYYTRKNTLMWHYGHTEEELKKAAKASERDAFKRGITKYFLPVAKVEDLVTSAGRKVKRVACMGKKTRSLSI